MIFSLEKIYTIAPSFRAEKSKTSRHLTEYWHAEVEGAWWTFDDVKNTGEAVIKHAFAKVLEVNTKELAILGRDIEKMKTDAEAHAAEDEQRKELVEVRNVADQAIYAAEKAIKDNGEKAGAEVVKEVQDKIDALKTARASEDTALIKTATESLSTTLSKIGEAMMKNQPPPAQDSGQTPPPEAAAGATDAEFKEKS